MIKDIVFAFGLFASVVVQPAPNDLSSIRPDQRRVAQCMLSAVQSSMRVSNARLQVILSPTAGDDAALTKQVFVDYDYAQVIPELKRQARTTHYNITPFLSSGRDGTIPVIVFEGIMPKPAPPGYFRDSHDGMMEISAVWEKNCLAKLRATGK